MQSSFQTVQSSCCRSINYLKQQNSACSGSQFPASIFVPHHSGFAADLKQESEVFFLLKSFFLCFFSFVSVVLVV